MNILTAKDWSKLYWEFRNQILRMTDPVSKSDLMKILDNIDGRLINNLSKEEVECRRIHRQTQKHKELVLEINDQIKFLDEMITFAVLIS